MAGTGDLRLFDLTLSNGSISGTGGAIYNGNGDLSLTNVTLSDNHSTSSGGGIYSTGGALTITGSTFIDNTASSHGGGVHLSSGTLDISYSRFDHNQAASGGGVFMVGTGSKLIEWSEFINNEATSEGGGIFIQSSAMTTLSNVLLTDNIAGSTGIGGGIFNQGPITITDNSILYHNQALYGGGILLSSGELTIDNSRLENNQAGWGAGLDMGNAEATIVDSALLSNDASENNGGGAFLIGSTSELTVSGSCIATNTIGSGSGSGISNPDGGSANAVGNWWGASTGPNTTNADTTLGTVTTFPHVSSAPGSCTVNPNATPTPTPTLTPTSAPALSPCEVIYVRGAGTLRIQPSLDEQNWLLRAPAYVYGSNLQVSGSAVPPRDWLWGGTTPLTVTIQSITAIAYVGVIGWVDPDVEWIQVEVATLEVDVLTGYMEYTNLEGDVLLPLNSCNVGALPAPTPDQSLPIVTPTQFAHTPRAPIFDQISMYGFEFNGKMGTFDLHDGANTEAPGTTIDIVPANTELCIDTRIDLQECDPTWNPEDDPSLDPDPDRIPVYAPVSGCATLTSDGFTITINMDRLDGSGNVTCSTEFPTQNGDRFVVLTHIQNPPLTPLNPEVITEGQILGELCLHDERSECGIDIETDVNTPIHLAFQLRRFGHSPTDDTKGLGNGNVYTEVIGFLAIHALYDEWALNQGATPTPPTPQYEGRSS